MKKIIVCSLLAVVVVSCTHQARRPSSEPILLPRTEFKEMVNYPSLNLKLRAGYSMETTELKACVLFLQGLADSIQNHRPYFSRLNDAGYRVIYFDYLGQGGSEGSMNDSRIQFELPPNPTRQMIQRYETKGKYSEIPEQADFIWSKYRSVKNSEGQSCDQSPKIVIGWSTGGLAAYRMAAEKRVDAVILLAPGIHPNWFVGETAQQWKIVGQTITERSLTRNQFLGSVNPHVDPIKPTNPLAVPQFAFNLKLLSYKAADWKIDSTIRGMVFLSGVEDTYVDREATLRTLRKNAPQFAVKVYDGALHELDNELPEVAEDLYENSVRFLDTLVVK